MTLLADIIIDIRIPSVGDLVAQYPEALPTELLSASPYCFLNTCVPDALKEQLMDKRVLPFVIMPQSN